LVRYQAARHRVGVEQLTGRPIYDALASILIGCVLSASAVWLAYETKGLLIGESANREVVDDIRRIAAQVEGIEQVHEVLSMHVGPQFILVAMTLELSSGRARRHAVDQLEARLKRSTRASGVFLCAYADRITWKTDARNEPRAADGDVIGRWARAWFPFCDARS
jgi:divalent metal cation (Fe/Co/Zn/Cd) transporter